MNRPSNFWPRCSILLPLIVILLDSRTFAGESPWVLTPGIGHDQFEQSYFFDDTLDVDPDSLRTLKRTIEELKESYVSFEGGYDRAFTSLSNTFYLTDAAERTVTQGRTRLRRGTLRLDTNGRFEWKGDDKRDSVSSSYWVGQLSATPRVEISERWSVLARGDWERTDYREETAYGLDYERLRGRFGARYSGRLLESIDLSVGVTTRDVPDSARLAYNEVWGEIEASYWVLGPTTWSALLSYRDRAYDEDESTRNHGRSAIELEARWQASPKTRVDGLLSWEYWNHAQDSGAYYDFSAGEVDVTGRYALSPIWEIALAGRTRWEAAAAAPFDEDDFAELGAGPELGWRPSLLVWVQIGALWGKRSYGGASLVYDDYDYIQLDLQADASFGDHIAASAVASYETENHEDSSRDADYVFGSFALRFPFRL